MWSSLVKEARGVAQQTLVKVIAETCWVLLQSRLKHLIPTLGEIQVAE